MGTLYANFLSGTTTDSPLTAGATTINSAAFANLPEVASPDTMWIVLDPGGDNGAPEIVQVTAHTASATSATVVRAQQDTTAREHTSGTTWRCAVTKSDLDGFLVSADVATALEDYSTSTEVSAEIDGDVTAAINTSGRGVMGYAQRTSNQSYTASAIADVSGVSVTFTAVAGRRYRVTVGLNTSSTTLRKMIREGSTVVAEQVNASTAGGLVFITNTSISGAKTWKLSIQGASNATIDCGPGYPAFILIEDIGAL